MNDIEQWERERLLESLDSYRRGLSDAPYLRKWTSIAAAGEIRLSSGLSASISNGSRRAANGVRRFQRRRRPTRRRDFAAGMASPVVSQEPGVPVGPRLHQASHRPHEGALGRGEQPRGAGAVRTNRLCPGGGRPLPGRLPAGRVGGVSDPSNTSCGGTRTRARRWVCGFWSKSCWR